MTASIAASEADIARLTAEAAKADQAMQQEAARCEGLKEAVKRATQDAQRYDFALEPTHGVRNHLHVGRARRLLQLLQHWRPKRRPLLLRRQVPPGRQQRRRSFPGRCRRCSAMHTPMRPPTNNSCTKCSSSRSELHSSKHPLTKVLN